MFLLELQDVVRDRASIGACFPQLLELLLHIIDIPSGRREFLSDGIVDLLLRAYTAC